VSLLSKITFRLANRVQVLDARDRSVPLFDPARASLSAGSAGFGLDPETLSQARKSVWRSITLVGWAGFVFNLLLQSLMIVLGTYGIYGMTTSAFTRPWDWVAPAVYCLCALIGLVTAWSQLRSTHAARLRNGFLAVRCCPSCGYALKDLPPDSDGCTVCPECGSAWRFETGLAALEKLLDEERQARAAESGRT
jgi:hypothetical protein